MVVVSLPQFLAVVHVLVARSELFEVVRSCSELWTSKSRSRLLLINNSGEEIAQNTVFFQNCGLVSTKS